DLGFRLDGYCSDLQRASWASRSHSSSRRSGMLTAQLLRRQRKVLQLGVRLLQRNLMILARRKAAVRVEAEALRRDVLESLLHTAGDALRRLDLGETDVHASQADLHLRRQFAQHGDVTGHRDAELQQELLHPQTLELIQNRLVAARGAPATPAP